MLILHKSHASINFLNDSNLFFFNDYYKEDSINQFFEIIIHNMFSVNKKI